MEELHTVMPEINPLERRISELKERSDKDWGTAPKYNQEYRLLRWPGVKKADLEPHAYYPNDDYLSPAVIGIDPRRLTPLWLSKLSHDKERKSNGLWNRYGGPHRRNETRMALISDIKSCMKENIPFKTRSLEYRPSDQWIYVCGNRTIRYDLDTGKLIAFTYSGVYNKVTSLMLRHFEINVTLVRRKLVWSREVIPTVEERPSHPGIRGQLETEIISLDRIYYLEDYNLRRSAVFTIDSRWDFRPMPGRPGPARVRPNVEILTATHPTPPTAVITGPENNTFTFTAPTAGTFNQTVTLTREGIIWNNHPNPILPAGRRGGQW